MKLSIKPMKLHWISSLFAVFSEEVSLGVVLMKSLTARKCIKNSIDHFVKNFLILSRSCNV